MMIKLSSLLEAQHILAEALASNRLKGYQKSFNNKRMGLEYPGDEHRHDYSIAAFDEFYGSSESLVSYMTSWNIPNVAYKSLFDYLNKEIPELNGLSWDKVKDEDLKPLKFLDKNGNVTKRSLVGKLAFWEDDGGNLVAITYDSKVVMIVQTETVWQLGDKEGELRDVLKKKQELRWSDREAKENNRNKFLEIATPVVVYSPKTKEMKDFPDSKVADLAHNQINQLKPENAYYLDIEYIENNQDFDKALSRKEWRIYFNKELNTAKNNLARYKEIIKQNSVNNSKLSLDIDKMFAILMCHVKLIRNVISTHLAKEDNKPYRDTVMDRDAKTRIFYSSPITMIGEDCPVNKIYEFLRTLNTAINKLLYCKNNIPRGDENASGAELADIMNAFIRNCENYNYAIERCSREEAFNKNIIYNGRTLKNQFKGLPLFVFDKADYSTKRIEGTNLSQIQCPQI